MVEFFIMVDPWTKSRQAKKFAAKRQFFGLSPEKW